jgi:hypothetical protein
MQPTIVFVYNADSGLFNTLTDIAHKALAPDTYNCNLCAITFGTFGMRAEWKAFLESLTASFEFLHRDELFERYGLAGIDLPAVFLKNGNLLQPWIGADSINACGSIDELRQLILARLAEEQTR